jgi:glycosyltransferase involved in cell wall biosynthesis
MPQKKKICILSELAYSLLIGKGIRGGSELQLTILAKELVKRSYDVSFITFDNSISSKEINEGISVYNIFDYKNSGYSYLNPINLYKIFKILKQINADIIIQGAVTPLTGILAFFSRLNNKSFIYSIESDDDIRIHLSIKSIKDLKNLFFRFGVKNSNIVICQTNYQRNLLKQTIDRDGVVIKNFYPFVINQVNKKDSSMTKILWVGRLRKEKRPDIFLQVAKLFPEHSFWMIGGPSSVNPNYYYEIKENAEKIKNLDFIGFVPHYQMQEYYKKSVFLVNTSANEGFPNTFLEAWGNEIPVISLNFDPDEIICRFKLGFHSSTINDLVKDMGQLLNNENLRKTMASNGKDYVLREHNNTNIINKYEQIFNEIKIC